MAITPLSIKSQEPLGGDLKRWNETSNIGNIIKKIEGITLNTDDEKSDSVVSGIPTPFARENMFISALKMSSDVVEEDSLNDYYRKLRKEWRGVIAAIALGYQRFSAKRIYLEYSESNQGPDQNLYEPRGAFGAMLFDRSDKWCDKNNLGHPFICTIKFDDILIGGTSPETLFFTSSWYKIVAKGDENYIEKGKFIEPTLSDFEGEDGNEKLQALYAYVSLLEQKTGGRTTQLAPCATYAHNELVTWRQQLQKELEKRKLSIVADKIPPVSIFGEAIPFAEVMDHKDKLYGANGWVYSENDEDRPDNAIPFDEHSLLLSHEAHIAHIILDDVYDDNIEKLPVNLLKAKKERGEGYSFFALPLTGLGLSVFGEDNLKYILKDRNTSGGSELSATYDEKEKKLTVTLRLRLKRNGEFRTPLHEEYKITDKVEASDLLIWPNFASSQWKRYFFYTELPSDNNRGVKALPFVCTPDLKTLEDENHEPLNLLTCEERKKRYVFNDENKQASLEKLVATSESANQSYAYEIYESNLPYKGIALQTKIGEPAGTLIINYTDIEDSESQQPKHIKNELNLTGTNIGVDFGSTNTSIAFMNGEKPEKLILHNRSVSLLRMKPADAENLATEERLFFFQQVGINSNEIKSILTLHDNRIVNPSSKVVIGGFPNFNSNLPVNSVNERFVELLMESNNDQIKVDVVHNMKWKDNDTDKDHKKAFINSIILLVYAELFVKEKYPDFLRWSYPSAMPDYLLSSLTSVWESLHDNGYNPLNEQDIRLADAPSGTSDLFGTSKQKKVSTSSSNDDMFGDMFGDSEPVAAKEDIHSDAKEDSESLWRLNNDDQSTSFEFEDLGKNSQALTEAYAVANYLYKKGEVSLGQKQNLAICFDIGGSTTDVSVLWGGTNNIKPDSCGVIKQNSIRFAAQFVSGVVNQSSRFKEVLRQTCEQFHLNIVGLKQGDKNRYTSETASYYFNLMVDRLKPNELSFFYKKIVEYCPELMAANLYVTSLIMVYAGIMMRKVSKRVRNSDEYGGYNVGDPKFTIDVKFAGKGARLMDWMSMTKGLDMAKAFYKQMFIFGFGKEWADYVNNCNILLSDSPSEDVKFEVSKGLAYEDFSPLRPGAGEDFEVVGEEGFWIKDDNGQKLHLPADNRIRTEMMELLGDRLGYDNSGAGPIFKKFAQVVVTQAIKLFNAKLDLDKMKTALERIDIINYLREDEEYLQARKRANAGTKKFDYVAPLLILEGIQFYKLMFKNK